MILGTDVLSLMLMHVKQVFRREWRPCANCSSEMCHGSLKCLAEGYDKYRFNVERRAREASESTRQTTKTSEIIPVPSPFIPESTMTIPRKRENEPSPDYRRVHGLRQAWFNVYRDPKRDERARRYGVVYGRQEFCDMYASDVDPVLYRVRVRLKTGYSFLSLK